MRRLNSWLAIVGSAVLLSACGGASGTAAGGANGTNNSAASSSGTAGTGGSTTDSSGTAGSTGSSSGTAGTGSGATNGTNTGTSTSGSTTGGGGTVTSFATPEEFFNAKVEPNVGFCRTCHVPGGVADTDAGRRMMLSSNTAEDYGKLQTSWTVLGKGVESNLILQNASGQHSHTGGAPWPVNSAQYNDMKTLLSCWDNPAACAALLAGADGGTTPPPPLLGDRSQTGARHYARAFCEGKADNAVLPPDPRSLWTEETTRREDLAVYFSYPWKAVHNETLFETQRRQNELRVAQGRAPIYSAKRRPKTCGEYRAAVASGYDFYRYGSSEAATFTNPAAFYEFMKTIADKQGLPYPEGNAAGLNALLRDVGRERYGLSPAPYRNPYPMPGEDPNKTGGGSLQLPVGIAQGKDGSGRWTGEVDVHCGVCHAGQLGEGTDKVGTTEAEGTNRFGVYHGLNGSNVDLGLLLNDVKRAVTTGDDSGAQIWQVTPGYLLNQTRGVNNVLWGVGQIVVNRDIDTLDFRGNADTALMASTLLAYPGSLPTTDSRMPPWWWLKNKATVLWLGGETSDSSRNAMLNGVINQHDGDWNKAREHLFDDEQVWMDSIEAPAYPAGFCASADGSPAPGDLPHCINRPLAEQGAVLFHEKNLWANGGNADIPAPKGNGACAGCHGVYAPRYAQDPRFLADPRLIGMTNYQVPISIMGVDQAEFGPGPSTGGYLSFSALWQGYPDAKEGYRMPEQKLPFEERADDFNPMRQILYGDAREDYVIGGHVTTPPLHGVWAAAPYFHNASIPNVWAVLKPSERPEVWLRQRTLEGMTAGKDRGFDTSLARAYDYDKLGWKYGEVKCGDGQSLNIPYYSCSPQAEPPGYRMFDAALGMWFMNFAKLFPPGEDAAYTRLIYNTNMWGKGREGHEFTQVLTDQERRALIEYLKTL